MQYKSNFQMFELGLIVVKIEIANFQAWPYYSAKQKKMSGGPKIVKSENVLSPLPAS